MLSEQITSGTQCLHRNDATAKMLTFPTDENSHFMAIFSSRYTGLQLNAPRKCSLLFRALVGSERIMYGIMEPIVARPGQWLLHLKPYPFLPPAPHKKKKRNQKTFMHTLLPWYGLECYHADSYMLRNNSMSKH